MDLHTPLTRSRFPSPSRPYFGGGYSRRARSCDSWSSAVDFEPNLVSIASLDREDELPHEEERLLDRRRAAFVGR